MISDIVFKVSLSSFGDVVDTSHLDWLEVLSSKGFFFRKAVGGSATNHCTASPWYLEFNHFAMFACYFM